MAFPRPFQGTTKLPTMFCMLVFFVFFVPVFGSENETVQNVFMIFVNPNGSLGDDMNGKSNYTINIDDNSSPVTEMSICLWIKPFRFLEFCHILSLLYNSNEPMLELKMTYEDVSIESFEGGAIKLGAYEWQHLCILYGKNVFIHFDQKTYKMTPTVPHQPLDMTNQVQVRVGAENYMAHSFSGMVADVRLYWRSISANEIAQISKFADTTIDYKTLTGTGLDTYYPNNDYLYCQEQNGNKHYKMDKSFILRNETTNFVTQFFDKVSCGKAKEICEKFGGHIPYYEDSECLETLHRLISEYIHVTEVQITSFWILKSTNGNKTCMKAAFNEELPPIQILNATSHVKENLKTVCVLNKKKVYYVKIKDETLEVNAVPNTEYVFEGFKNGLRIFWLNNKVKIIDLYHGVPIGKIFLPGPSYLMGRKEMIMAVPHGQKIVVIFSVCSNSQFTCSSGNCIEMKNVCDFQADCPDGSDEEFCEVGIPPPQSYEKRLAPTMSKTDKVKVSLKLSLWRMVDIQMEKNIVTLTLKVTVKWKDHRLQFKNLVNNFSNFVHDNIVQQIWHPRITMKEGISDQDNLFHLDTFHGRLLATNLEPGRLTVVSGYEVFKYDGKTVQLTHKKIETVSIICRMDLSLFPFDTQTCNLTLALEGKIRKDVEWDQNPKISIKKRVKHLLLYSNVKFYFHVPQKHNHALRVILSMKRKNGAYIFNTFLPCFILESIGLLTLLMPYDDYQDRVTVTLSCLIVMAALFTQVSSSLPVSADPKLIDTWMFIHVCLLFLVFLIHVLVNFVHRKTNKSDEKDTGDIPNNDYSMSSNLFRLNTSIKPNVVTPFYDVRSQEESKHGKKRVLPCYAKVNICGLSLCILSYAIFFIIFFYQIQ